MVDPPALGRLFSAIATPQAADGSLPKGVVGQLAASHVERGVEGIYCCGSSGEGLLLTTDERRQVLEEVLEAVGERVPVVAHVGSLSTREAMKLGQHARVAGATAVSMIPPIYYGYTQEEVVVHYRMVMDASELPMILYNIPQFTAQEFEAAHPLLSDPRVVGMKHTAHSMYQLERMAAHHPDLQLINGFDETYLAATVAGASGTIGTTVSLQVDTFKAVRHLLARGEVAKAQAFQHRINHTIEELVAVGVFPAAKWIEEQVAAVPLGPCRGPFAPVAAGDQPRLQALIEKLANDRREARAVLSV